MLYTEGQRVAYIGGVKGYERFFEKHNADYKNLRIIHAYPSDNIHKVGVSESISLFFSESELRITKNNIKKL